MTAPNDEYAEDVTDLHEAQRIIAQLRRTIAQQERVITELEEFATPVDGEFTAFLDEEHARMLEVLFNQCKLVYDQDPDDELLDVCAQFVQDWLDVQWDGVQLDKEGAAPTRITPSA